jgi:hypothetical protein
VITLPEKNRFQERDNEDSPPIQAAIAG